MTHVTHKDRGDGGRPVRSQARAAEPPVVPPLTVMRRAGTAVRSPAIVVHVSPNYSMIDASFGQRLFQPTNSVIADLRSLEAQQVEVGQSGEVCQAGVGGPGVVEQ